MSEDINAANIAALKALQDNQAMRIENVEARVQRALDLAENLARWRGTEIERLQRLIEQKGEEIGMLRRELNAYTVRRGG
jgi:uncharacterized protein Yka (UPF0111/DUF47 family)